MTDADREPTGVPVVGKRRGLTRRELIDVHERARPWWGRLLTVVASALVGSSIVRWFAGEDGGLGRNALGFAVGVLVLMPLWWLVAQLETSWHARNDRRRDAAERSPAPDPDSGVTTP